MARPNKKTTETVTQDDEFILEIGKYKVTKPSDKYVVRLGGNVVYADTDLDKVNKYLSLIHA